MVKDLVIIPDPLLNRRSTNVKNFKNIKRLMVHMRDTLIANGGVGISAVQIGKLKRAFIIKDHNFIPIINPIILFVEEEQDSKEKCLSCPNIEANIIRPEVIGVQFLDLDRKMHTMKFEGKLAAIFAHEYDHLEGILISDLVGSK